jgi:cbb3-type cytochrome oxidase subunit 1
MYIINIVVDMDGDVCGIDTQDDWAELSWRCDILKM